MEEKIYKMRHSLAHLLGGAVLSIWPDVKIATGPAIDNGFYYDFDFGLEPADSSGLDADSRRKNTITEKDLGKIEQKMRETIKKWKSFEKKTISYEEAKKLFTGNPYKLELIEEYNKDGKELTVYISGPDSSLPISEILADSQKLTTNNFVDLCAGPHIEDIKEIKSDAFKLERIAGAYWKGNENNKMLTRIYGLAFATKEELEAFEKMQEEGKKRDHRKLGEELKIFMFDEDVGPGLPLWLPNGTVIVEELEKLAKETENAAGYLRVKTPHLAKESMYLMSGHLPYYKESMYPSMELEGVKYYLKAMNCPHHHKIYGNEKRSYKDLPIRLAEYGTCYRNEKSGELFGLMRVRMLSMNDAHMYCTEDQFSDEFKAVNDMYLKYFKIFGVEKYIMRFSTHDPKKLGEKFVNEPLLWKKTEDMVRQVLIDSKIPYVEVPNEAAFYGPKIDVQVWSAIGREFTLATNQVDFAVPKRFGLTYITKEGKEETPLCIHRAPLGTHERFIGFLIEHYAGNFPLWLSPIQIKIVPVRENHNESAMKIGDKLKELGIRVDCDTNEGNMGGKIRDAKNNRVPYTVIIGDKDLAVNKITVESRDEGQLGQMTVEEFVEKIKKEKENRE
jgi:threonyl-tRNA synthetase